MASYSATIEVGTRGTAALEKLLARVNTLSGSIDKVNRNPVFGSKQVASLNEYNRTLKEATANLAKTRVVLNKSGQAAGNYAKAIKDYVDALGLANGAQDLTNKLVKQEIQGREKATAALKKYNAAAASARQPGGSMAGRYLRPGQARGTTQFAGPIGPGQASSVFGGQSSAVEGRIKRILEIKKGELQLEKALIGLQQKSRGLDAASIADNNRILDIKAKEVSQNNEIIRQEKVKQSILRKRQKLEAAGRGPGGGGGGRRRRGGRFQDIATGAGFPLLFGGGPIQALAGGLGGAAGGLGGSILASALTAQVEAFAKGAAETGQALTSTSGALDLMREKSLFSKDATEKLAAELEGLGEIEKLSTLLTTELVQKIGNEGVTALQDLGTESDKTTRLWSALTLQLQALIAGPLKDFFALINSVLGAVTTSGQFKILESELTGQARTDFSADVASRRAASLAATASGTGGAGGMMSSMGTAGGVGVLSPADQRELVEKYLPKLQVTASIPVTEQDRKDFSVKGGRAKKARKSKLPELQAELALQERLAVLARQVTKAKADEDPIREAALSMEIALEQLATKTAKIKLEDLTADEKGVKIKIAELATDERIFKAQNQLNAAKANQAKQAAETIENLEFQFKLTKAITQAERDQLEIDKQIKELRDKNYSEDQISQITGLMQSLSEANEPLNKFIKQSTESLIDLETRAVEVAQGIGTAIGNSLVNGMQSLVTGAATVKEVFADMLNSVASVLAKQAAQMIATYIAIGIAKKFAGLLGGGGGMGGNNYFDPKTGLGVAGPNFGLAEGGYVSGPTNALIGEGGEPEYVIPESKMRESMARYSRGSRGSGVIPESSGGGAESGGGVAVAAPIDVRYTVERINSVDYVTADQFQSGMQRAAEQGAKQGEQSTLKRLQMSGSTRKRLGL